MNDRAKIVVRDRQTSFQLFDGVQVAYITNKIPFQVGLNLHASQSIDTISLCKTCSTRCGPFSSNAHIHSYYHIHTSYYFLFQSYTYQTPFHPHTLTKPESLRKAHSFPVSFSHTSSSSHTVPFLFYLL